MLTTVTFPGDGEPEAGVGERDGGRSAAASGRRAGPARRVSADPETDDWLLFFDRLSSLTAFGPSLLARGDLATVLGLLTGVRGVGAARAGWFLRDLAGWEEPSGPVGDHAPEPVDGHVRRAVTTMAGESLEARGVDAGAWLRERCGAAEARAHRVSAGISYFGERIAGDPFTLEGCLGDLGRAKQLVERHRERLAAAASNDECRP